MRLRSLFTLFMSLLVVGCDAAGDPDGGTGAELVGAFRLVSIAPECDYHTGERIKTGGTFSAIEVDGTIRFDADGVVHHAFDIQGTCAFPDGTSYVLNRSVEDTGTYVRAGSRVTIEHQGITCNATLSGNRLTVRTGTLAPPYRFSYQFEKE